MKSYEEIKQQQKEELLNLIDFAGNQSRLARALGVTPQVVQNWVQRGRISATCAIDCEYITKKKFTKEQLRPDVDTWKSE